MSTTDEQGGSGRDEDETQELAEGGGVGVGAGEPSTFEPEEDPDVPAAEPPD